MVLTFVTCGHAGAGTSSAASMLTGAYSRIEQDIAGHVDRHDLEQKPDQDVNRLVRDVRELLFSKTDYGPGTSCVPNPKTLLRRSHTVVSALKENIWKAAIRLDSRGGSWSSFD